MELGKRLVLNKYFLNLFGFENLSDFLEKFKNIPEGFHSGGNSHFVDVIIMLENLKIPKEEILRYDQAIKGYSERLSRNGRENISLKYFQYFAVLFSEIFLDRYFNRRKEFLAELNSFTDELNEDIAREDDKFVHFDESDLEKLAYWMATGSGKTLIMHINYWQFLKYSREKLDNVILVTPNEGMSKQHYNEMQRSGIPCRLYFENINNLSIYPNNVLIIDIHKLTEEKKGAGVRVEVDYFEGRNLVFIDEGHKGAGTEEKTWKHLRESLAKTGFIFEYSATFGQVIGLRDKDLLQEYSRAIIFDYQYKYFYMDGYGKDFYVYNLKEKSFQKKFRDFILTGNLLSFYEQILLYESQKEELKNYLIEKPLWAFIGSKVSGAGLNSDVLKIVQFLKCAIENRKLLKERIERVLSGNSGLEDLQGNDIFKDRFEIIRQNGYKIDDVYDKIFNSKSGSLLLYELKSAEGEIGLKIGEGDYFGVINIGDVGSFKKLLAESGIEVKSDNITSSLFDRVNEHNSNINIIIGAKKFIEGWDSWRVCSMGLINIGKGEGPQIIQLFGRGVRLKGRNFSLKRSEENKYQVRALETLNIFGLNADYMNRFLEAIRKEDVDLEEISIPIRLTQENKKWNKLYILQKPKDFDFSSQLMELEIDKDILSKVKIDIRPRIKLAHGLQTGEIEGTDEAVVIEEKYIDLLNWNEIYFKILNYKIACGYSNLSIDKELLINIVKGNSYKIYAFPEQITPKTFGDLANLQEIISMILRCYIDQFYKTKKRSALSEKLRPVHLIRDNENFRDYTVRIPKAKKEDIKNIRKLLKQIEQLYQTDLNEFPRIHFDRHLYTPLLIYRKAKDYIKSIPPQLNEKEAEFILILRKYLVDNQNEFKDKDIFLLRNLSRRGVEFFQTRGYYPDYIMWVCRKDKQTVAFIDPKGIRNVEDEKIQLHNDIKKLEKKIGRKNISLESFIISVSEYNKLKKMYAYAKRKKESLEQDNVFFIEDKAEMIRKLFGKIV